MSSTPSIRISQIKRNTSQPAYDSLGEAAMAIPRAREPVPPPLPPPTYLPEISAACDPGWKWGNDRNGDDFGRPAMVKAGSSLLGGSFRQGKKEHVTVHRPFDQGREIASVSNITFEPDREMLDESLAPGDENAIASRRPSNPELRGEKELQQRTREESSQTYDKHLLSRIGGPNTPKRQSISYSPSPAQESTQLGPFDAERRHNSLRPLSVPERRHSSNDTAISTKLGSSGAVSPGFTGFWTEHFQSESGRFSASRHGSLTFGETDSHRGSYDHSMFVNDDFYMEESQLSNLNIEDRSPGSPKAGSKRRASSPPREREDRSSVSSAPGQSEALHRRSMQQLITRHSPVYRFPNYSSLSSASSLTPRHGSLGSSLGVTSVPSSATSYGSGRLSPSPLSPRIDADLVPAIKNPDPAAMHHQRTMSESAPSVARKLSADNVAHSRHGSLSQLQGMYMCECCPKKPRKFDTEEGLKLHENEKQYTCAYCTNRFKNKNEAERHQNSLHLRRHSWSCAALLSIEAAYHSSQNAMGVDACGYCGQEFPNPPQWDIRAEHLNQVHKFGECNQAKKFFRADHFRQHLKHSHQGTSGKWTNVLEIACMKDEPAHEKRVSSGAVSTSAGQAPPALMVSTTGLAGPNLPPSSATIEETPHDT